MLPSPSKDIGIKRQALHPNMIRHLGAFEVLGVARWCFAEHRRLPGTPLADKPVINVLVSFLQIGALQWIVGHVEQERVAEDLEVFPVTVPCSALPLVAPVGPKPSLTFVESWGRLGPTRRSTTAAALQQPGGRRLAPAIGHKLRSGVGNPVALPDSMPLVAA
jgi:hypothetical protein